MLNVQPFYEAMLIARRRGPVGDYRLSVAQQQITHEDIVSIEFTTLKHTPVPVRFAINFKAKDMMTYDAKQIADAFLGKFEEARKNKFPHIRNR
jgi:hypothetical protein